MSWERTGPFESGTCCGACGRRTLNLELVCSECGEPWLGGQIQTCALAPARRKVRSAAPWPPWRWLPRYVLALKTPKELNDA